MALTKAGMIAAIVAQLDSDGHDSTAIASALQWGSICDALATYIEANIAAGSGAWELLDSHVSSADEASFSFSGLNGNTALIYKLVFDILTPTGTTVRYDVRPNGLTTNQEAQRLVGSGSSAIATAGYNRMALALTSKSRVCGEAIIAASSGEVRVMTNHMGIGETTPDSTAGVWASVWSDTSTNITSLTIAASTASTDILQNSRFYLYGVVTS